MSYWEKEVTQKLGEQNDEHLGWPAARAQPYQEPRACAQRVHMSATPGPVHLSFVQGTSSHAAPSGRLPVPSHGAQGLSYLDYTDTCDITETDSSGHDKIFL